MGRSHPNSPRERCPRASSQSGYGMIHSMSEALTPMEKCKITWWTEHGRKPTQQMFTKCSVKTCHQRHKEQRRFAAVDITMGVSSAALSCQKTPTCVVGTWSGDIVPLVRLATNGALANHRAPSAIASSVISRRLLENCKTHHVTQNWMIPKELHGNHGEKRSGSFLFASRGNQSTKETNGQVRLIWKTTSSSCFRVTAVSIVFAVFQHRHLSCSVEMKPCVGGPQDSLHTRGSNVLIAMALHPLVSYTSSLTASFLSANTTHAPRTGCPHEYPTTCFSLRSKC